LKHTVQKEPTLRRQVVESSSSLIFLALKVPSEPTKLLGTNPGDTLTTQTTRLLSTSLTTTGSSLKQSREHLRKRLQRSFKPTPSQRKRNTKIRYQEWLFAGDEDSGEKFFVDLWDPKALKAFSDPDKDTHPGAQLLRDWNKVKEKEKNKRPTPKRFVSIHALERS
jgi:hypothetical protein